MNLLVLGSGGREHALCWALAASPLCDALYCAPGNGGIQNVAECVALDPMDFDAVIGFCRERDIEFVVVGPEAPLAAGVVDALEAAGIEAFGPTATAAVLESSKGFTRDLCARHAIPGPAYARFDSVDAARDYVRKQGAPIVIKADGLAAGKGVTVALEPAAAETALDDIAAGAFGAAGAEIVVEEFLTGIEASFFALVDGATALPLAGAQDHKQVGEGDTGPNTGGMGAYSPAPILTDELQAEVMRTIIQPTVDAMAADGRRFVGILYAGLMLTDQGPKLLEYNVRFGDPECQVLMPRLRSDLLPALMAAHDGELDKFDLRWSDRTALCVVLASKGYPGSYQKGTVINGLDRVAETDMQIVFHAGTAVTGDQVTAIGGRVLGVTALAEDLAGAQTAAYQAVDQIDWPDGFCRRDIGWRALGS